MIYQKPNLNFNVSNYYHPLQSHLGLINPYAQSQYTVASGEAFSRPGGGSININPPGPAQPHPPFHININPPGPTQPFPTNGEPVLNPTGPSLPHNGISSFSYSPGHESMISPVGHPYLTNLNRQ
jgi:hypothetical protein